jgi:hypothetical protein
MRTKSLARINGIFALFSNDGSFSLDMLSRKNRHVTADRSRVFCRSHARSTSILSYHASVSDLLLSVSGVSVFHGSASARSLCMGRVQFQALHPVLDVTSEERCSCESEKFQKPCQNSQHSVFSKHCDIAHNAEKTTCRSTSNQKRRSMPLGYVLYLQRPRLI